MELVGGDWCRRRSARAAADPPGEGGGGLGQQDSSEPATNVAAPHDHDVRVRAHPETANLEEACSHPVWQVGSQSGDLIDMVDVGVL